MRIIGGQAKGQRLISPEGTDVRPTSDRVREAIFNSIQKRVADSIVIDLYAGAGSLGIEALSRFARKAYLIDRSQKQIQLIKKNLEKTQLDNAVLMCHEVEDAIKILIDQKVQADIIFMDPPYGHNYIETTLRPLSGNTILAPEGIIVAECGRNEQIPDEVNNLHLSSIKRYGYTKIAYYIRKEETEHAESTLPGQF